MINYRQIAEETLEIIKKGGYLLNGSVVSLGDCNNNNVEVISPQKAADYVQRLGGLQALNAPCEIVVDNLDSYEAVTKHGIGKTLVLNFANAYTPGGGFLRGALAQEEFLCRCSTLYASISGGAASEMYAYNREHNGPGGSDYMLLSPDVIVFRDTECWLLEKPFKTSVITAAAPNLDGDAFYCTEREIEKLFDRKIKNVVAAAAVNRYETLILGAWGCGAFGNNAKDVAEYFYNVLVCSGMQRYFRKIVFAVYSKHEGYNLAQFQKRFNK